jgi:hypothetical protein
MGSENRDEITQSMRQALKTLSELVQEDNVKKSCHFLPSFLNNDEDLFLRFLAFLQAEMAETRYKKSVAASIWVEVALTALSLGHRAGYEDAKRVYSAI